MSHQLNTRRPLGGAAERVLRRRGGFCVGRVGSRRVGPGEVATWTVVVNSRRVGCGLHTLQQ